MHASCLRSDAQPLALYEQEELHALTGGTLRPGGLALTRELLRFCQVAPAAAVLDVGCGPGQTLALMAAEFEVRPAGLDPSAAMLARAAQLVPQAELRQAVATAIPWAEASFDGVIAECTLSLTGDLAGSLAEMHRVVRPGGFLILTDIYCKHPGRADLPPIKSCLTSALPLEAITEGVNRAGFSLVLLHDRSQLLKQLAGQIIFSFGSLEKFWALFLDAADARSTTCALAAAPLGYYVLIARKGAWHG